MKFVGFYSGPHLGFGPPSVMHDGAVNVSCTWQGLGCFAIGDDGQVYALCYRPSDPWPTGSAQKLYWLRVSAEVATL